MSDKGSKPPVTQTGARKVVSVAELAAHLQITPRQVYKLIAEGKIDRPDTGIVLEVAVGQYVSRTSPQHRMADALARGKQTAPIAMVPPAPRPRRPKLTPEISDEPDEDGDPFDYQEARAKKEQHNADLAELKLLQARGQLLLRDVVIAREFDVARKLRERILGFPARLANFVPSEAMKVITEECERLVEELREDASRICEAQE